VLKRVIKRTYSYPHLTVRKQSVDAAVKRLSNDKKIKNAGFVV